MVNLIEEFEAAGAILKGHFILSSGLHSDTYLQCARALMDPKRAERLCAALAQKLSEAIDVSEIDIVVAPAMGGLIVGYETAKQLSKPSIFCERVNGSFELRRGFTLEPNQKVLVIEDVVTTGKSSLETFDLIHSTGAKVVAEAALINRSGIENPLGDVPLVTLEKLNIQTFDKENIPENLRDIEAVKPGSRWLAKKAG